MLGKTFAVLALTASIGAFTISPSLASSKSTTENSPWYDTNSNAALSRANLSERVLSRSTVTKVKYLRSVVGPPLSPKAPCLQATIAAPVLVGGYLYAITAGKISKYNAATGSLIWRRTPNQTFIYKSLAVSDNLVIAGGRFCESESEPGGIVDAFNVSTGKLVWSSGTQAFTAAVAASSYVVIEGTNAAGDTTTVLNVTDGKQVWSSPGCGGSSTTEPIVVDSLVMSSGCSGNPQDPGAIQANDLATGALAWSLTGNWSLLLGDQSGPNGKHLYAIDPTGTIVDLNPLTGQVEYSLTQALTVLAVDSSRVYATCGNQPDICGYNSGTGALEWQDTPINFPGLAAEADGVLYLNYGSALNTATGLRITRIWTTGGDPLAVGDGRIAIGGGPRIIDLYGLQGY
jgi:outer membrane protein assembly factor BamB